MNQSSIQSDVEISGSIKFTGELTFDGALKDGNITGGVLVVGPKARIKGDIQSDTLTLHGSVVGDVLVAGKCDLKGSSSLEGSLTTNRLVMDEGATMIGRAEITPQATKRPTPPSAPPKA